MNPERLAPGPSAAVTDEPPPVAAPCRAPDRPCRAHLLELRQHVGSGRAMHPNAVSRCNDAHEESERLRAQLRLRERQRFERKSGKSSSPSASAPATTPPLPRRPRGQQRGRPSPPRRCHDPLPVVEEPVDVPADPQQCPRCGQPWRCPPGTEGAALLEIDVRAWRRV